MAGKPIIKITDYIERELDYEKIEMDKLGVDFSYYQLKPAAPEELIDTVHDADFLVVNMARIPQKVMAGLDNVKVIIRHGIGYDNLDLPAATQNGIICANQPTASSEDVAEQAIMLMLAVYRKLLIQSDILKDSVAQRKWAFDRIYPVFRMGGKTLGIIGCGNIGSIVLRKMRSFGMRILVCDPYLSKERLQELGIEHTPIETVLKESDIVTVHVPVTQETRGMFDTSLLRLMKKTAVLINTARGPLVNVHDLAEAVRSKMIAGAGVDVYDFEPPPPDYELFGLDTVILTPHLAWYSEEGGWDIRVMIVEDLKRCLEGKLPHHVINPEVFHSPKLRMKV
ncbi:MAG: C-terminal binding protein [Candidatus Latescibacterota bacterium]